jgi:N-acetylglucosaminyldiphosphoundecaprenol N-acetyl-beta-D-mannosaminyltransferase
MVRKRSWVACISFTAHRLPVDEEKSVLIEPGRIDVLGSQISAVDSEQALRLIQERLSDGRGGYVCFTNVHTTVTGRRDARLRAATNGSFLSLADGKPVYWLARRRGAAGHIPGPDFMALALDRCRHRRHFFYGSTSAVLDRLTARLREVHPGIDICGVLSPPFRALTAEEKQQHYALIRATRADFVWVGLGAPKQELWMAESFEALRPAILLGVGAAFDFHAEVVSRAPAAWRALGLEWLFRLIHQPRRLWRRYLVTNTHFVAYLLRDTLLRAGGQSTPRSGNQ